MQGALDVVIEVQIGHLGRQTRFHHGSGRAVVGSGAEHDERGALDGVAQALAVIQVEPRGGGETDRQSLHQLIEELGANVVERELPVTLRDREPFDGETAHLAGGADEDDPSSAVGHDFLPLLAPIPGGEH